MGQFIGKKLGLLVLLAAAVFSATAQQQTRQYNQLIVQKFDKNSGTPLKVKQQIQTFVAGTVSLSDKILTLDTTKYMIIMESPLQIKKDYIFKHVLLAPVRSNNHRTYDCVLSYKNTTGTIKNDMQSGLYAVEFWKSDLTCYYYLLTL